jgi:phage tail-like protein
MASGNGEDPLIGFTFRLDISGQIAGFFTECSGIGSENEVIDHKVVDDQGQDLIKKIPGRMKWTDVTLKRGVTSSMEIYDWRQKVIDGKVDDARTNCSIHLLSRDYQDIAAWHFEDAWPSKVSGPTIKSDSNEIAIEEVTIVHQKMYRET